jgi:hypothetical protein
MKKSLLMLVVGLLALSGVIAAYAQDTSAPPRISYYLAADANGVQQVFQLSLSGDNQSRQITHATSDIIAFGAAYDGLAVAYVSGGKLWLQAVDSDASEALASVSVTSMFGSPIWSQDGQYLAYADNGVWMMDMGTRQTRQLLANVELDPSASNADKLRLYSPQMFAVEPDGKASKLIVDIGVWEWGTAGVYDLATGQLQELQGHVHTHLLPLSDGRVLVYGNNGLDGASSLHIAGSFADINTNSEVLNFSTLTDAVLFAEQAVEIQPSVVRVFGSTIGGNTPPDVYAVFYFDYTVSSGVASALNVVPLSTGAESSNTNYGKLSPDGSLLPVYLNALWTDAGTIYGQFKLFDLGQGAATAVNTPKIVSAFQWQP